MSETIVSFDENNIPEFVAMYRTAKERGDSSFTFEEHEFSTAYAKYLIEYLAKRMTEGEKEHE